MSKFRVSDPVRIIAQRTRWFDQVGTVADIAAGQFRVAGIDPGPVWFRADELVLAEWPQEGA